MLQRGDERRPVSGSPFFKGVSGTLFKADGMKRVSREVARGMAADGFNSLEKSDDSGHVGGYEAPSEDAGLPGL